MNSECLDPIMQFYDHTLSSYDVLYTNIISRQIPAHQIPPAFIGITPSSLNRIMQELAKELNREVVLTTVAITENEIRLHYEGLGKKRIREFRILFRKYRNRARLEDILDEWKDLLPAPRVVSEFKQVLNHRHWLAHGRPAKRRPTEFTPSEADLRARSLLRAIESYL